MKKDEQQTTDEAELVEDEDGALSDEEERDTSLFTEAPREVELEGGRTYVFGDIHGCALELEALLSHIESDDRLAPEDLVVFIGDYIDRGPDSYGVVEQLLSFRERVGAEVLFLKGNHEEMFLSWLGLGGEGSEVYLMNGGVECLESYGISEKTIASLQADGAKVRDEIPEHHLRFYEELLSYVISEQFVFVHAGLSPLRDLYHQVPDDVFWIRDEFIQNIHYFQKTIVFGHTPFEDVLFHLPYKIGIDTGLVYGNALTVLELSEERVFQVEADSTAVEEFHFREKGGFWPKSGKF
ncbi:serine/threonine protein phosphatase [bacterium]|nr:serine/threonine protein phosphatase [bacterium]